MSCHNCDHMSLQLALTWATQIQSIPSHFTSLRSILTIHYHLCLCLPSGPLFSGSWLKFLCICHLPIACNILYPSNPPWVTLIFGKHYKVWCSLGNFPSPPVTSSPLHLYILLSTFFSGNLDYGNTAAHSYKTGKIICCYILIITSIDVVQKDWRFQTEQ